MNTEVKTEVKKRLSFPPNLGGCCADGIGGMSPVNDKGKGSWSDGVGVKVGVGDFEGDDGTVESGGSGRKVIVVDEQGFSEAQCITCKVTKFKVSEDEYRDIYYELNEKKGAKIRAAKF